VCAPFLFGEVVIVHNQPVVRGSVTSAFGVPVVRMTNLSDEDVMERLRQGKAEAGVGWTHKDRSTHDEFSKILPWRLRVMNSAPQTAIRLQGTSNGQSWEIPGWAKVDTSGSFTVGATFARGTEGTHTLTAEIAGASSDPISFVVSNCNDD